MLSIFQLLIILGIAICLVVIGMVMGAMWRSMQTDSEKLAREAVNPKLPEVVCLTDTWAPMGVTVVDDDNWVMNQVGGLSIFKHEREEYNG